MAKDLFSEQSRIYAKFRPTYPKELFDYILEFVEQKKQAWDCATGNGQAASALAEYFEKVDASDISEAQIASAIKKPNIEYHVCPAEQTPFAPNTFDLITVAQAYHWLNWKEFNNEATRVGKPDAVVAIWTYNLLSCQDKKVNQVISHFYRDITGPYWDYERRYVDDGYASVDFDFGPLVPKKFETGFTWKKQQLIGYFQTWSSVQKYMKVNKQNPIGLVEKDIDAVWADNEEKQIIFPVFLRLGRIIK